MTYENKFVNTLVDRLYIFINRRYEKLALVSKDEEVFSLGYDSTLDDGAGGKMKISVNIETIDSLDTYDDKGHTVWQRIEKLRKAIEGYKGSDVCRTLGNTFIRPPVMRTNAIMKNVDLKACLTLWQYIESYDKVGYEINIENTAVVPQNEYVNDFYKVVVLNLLLFRSYMNKDNEDKLKKLKTQSSKSIAPKFVKKFDKELADDYNITSETTAGYIGSDGEFKIEKRLPKNINQMFDQITQVINIETNYREELDRKRLEDEKRRQEEEERLKEQQRIEAERREELLRIQKEKEEEEKRVQEMLAKKRAEQEEEERKRQQLEAERLARVEEIRKRQEEARLKREEEERIRAERERIERNKELARAELGEAEGIDEETLHRNDPDEKLLEQKAYNEVTEEEVEEVKAEMSENASDEEMTFEDPRAVAARKKLEQQKLEKERIETERAQRLKAERKKFESKPFMEIYREYSWNPIYVLIRTVRYVLAVVFGVIPSGTDNPFYKQLAAKKAEKQEIEEREKHEREIMEVYYKKYGHSFKYDLMRFIGNVKFKRKKRLEQKNRPRPAYTPPVRTPEEQQAIDREMKRLYREYHVSLPDRIIRAFENRKREKAEFIQSINESAEIAAQSVSKTEETEEKSSKITNIIIAAITVIALGFVIYVMVCSANGKAVNVFGKSVLKVVTGSMEPSLQIGDYIVVEKTDPSALKEGDIISFYSEQSDINGMLVTHRIVSINDDGSFVTKGDANLISDSITVSADKIVGKYTHKSRFFMWVDSFVNIKKLIILLVVVSMTIMSVYEVRTVLSVGQKVAEERRQANREKYEKAMREAIEKEKLRLETEGYDPEKEVNTGDTGETDEGEND